MATAKKSPRAAVAPTVKPASSKVVKASVKAPGGSDRKKGGVGLSFAAVMSELERAGTAQNRKIYARHGAKEPMFGVSFAVLKTLVKRIGVDHDLAVELWRTGNHDACVLAAKVADPARITSAELDRWAAANRVRSCGGYVAMLAAESPHGRGKVESWLASKDENTRATGWVLAGFLATLDETIEDSFFLEFLARIEKTIHVAPNGEREPMNQALIAIGGRNAALRKAAIAAAKRIGKIEVDHGETSCKTPDAADYIEKTWAYATAKKFASPAAQERAREPMRTRC